METEWSVRVSSEPAAEPLSLAEAQAHLLITGDEAEFDPSDAVKAARKYVERHLSRSLITQTLELRLDAWPACGVIYLPQGPVQSVSSINYTDSSGVTTAYTAYDLDKYSTPARIVPDYGTSWPSVTLQPVAGIVVTYVAGYGAAGSNVPEDIRRAIRMLVGHFWENREAILTGTISKELELSVSALLYDYKATHVG